MKKVMEEKRRTKNDSENRTETLNANWHVGGVDSITKSWAEEKFSSQSPSFGAAPRFPGCDFVVGYDTYRSAACPYQLVESRLVIDYAS